MYTTSQEQRIADLRRERDCCMKAARVARALQDQDLTIDMVCEARDLHERSMRAKHIMHEKHLSAAPV